MLRGVVDLISRTDSAKLEPVLRTVAQGFGTMSAELLFELLSTEHGRADKAADLVLQVASRMTDATLGEFVARSVITHGGATTRLAQAFQALVPDADRRPALLELARARAGVELPSAHEYPVALGARPQRAVGKRLAKGGDHRLGPFTPELHHRQPVGGEAARREPVGQGMEILARV